MASDLKAVRAAIEGRIEANWDQDVAPVSWEGNGFDRRKTDAPDEPPDGPWIQPVILWGDGFLDTFDGRNEIVGVLNTNLFDLPGNGTGQLEELADDFRDLFNRVEVSGVRFEAPSGPKPPTEDRKGWMQTTVTVPFTVEEIVT